MQHRDKTVFWRRVKITGGCWEWQGPKTRDGYGKFSHFDEGANRQVTRGTHRYSYEQVYGRLLPGMDLHHTCENKICVRPEHLTPIPHTDHFRLSPRSVCNKNRLKTHCKHGHEFTPENTSMKAKGNSVWRECRECRRFFDKQPRHSHRKTGPELVGQVEAA